MVIAVINRQKEIIESCFSFIKRNVINNKLTALCVSETIYLLKMSFEQKIIQHSDIMINSKNGQTLKSWVGLIFKTSLKKCRSEFALEHN